MRNFLICLGLISSLSLGSCATPQEEESWIRSSWVKHRTTGVDVVQAYKHCHTKMMTAVFVLKTDEGSDLDACMISLGFFPAR